jgi:hypothetical protein
MRTALALLALAGCATAPTLDSLWQQQAASWGREDTPTFRRDATACMQEAQAAMGGVTSSGGSGAAIGATVPVAQGFAVGGVLPVGDDPVQRTFFRLREQCMYGRGYSRYDSPAMREEVVLDCKRHYPKQLGMFESELRQQDKCIEEGLQGLKDGPAR